jgi:O-antigen/teichoic acid export membrane protein
VARKSKLFAGDQALRKRLLSIGHLLTGNLFSSLVGFVAFALTARTLGPVDYGILALVYSYARAVERLISFQSWQPLIKYGAGLFDGGDQNELRSLLKFGLILDVGAAALAWAIAVLIALGGASLMGWTERTVDALLIYSFSMLFQVTGMPTAVMRLAGRFRTIAYGQLGTAIVRMILCAVGAYMMWGLVYFAAVWAASHILGAMTSLAFALYTLRQRGVNRLLSAPLAGLTKHFPGIWNFAWTANLSLTIRSSAQEFDTLLVGALSDPASAGLYHIAKRVSRVAQQIAVQVQAVLYPDVARLWAQQATEKFKRAVYQVEVLLFGLGVCLTVFFYFAAAPLLKVSVGAAFLGAAPLLIVQAIAVTLNLTGSSVRSALLAMGQQRRVLNIVFAATLAFHLTALAAIPQIGAMGANVAHIAFGLVWLSGLSWAFRSALKQGSSPPAVQDRGSEKSLDEEAEP